MKKEPIMKITFKCEYKDSDNETYHTIKIDTTEDNRDEIIKVFEQFLQGCGFSLNGPLVVEEPDFGTND